MGSLRNVLDNIRNETAQYLKEGLKVIDNYDPHVSSNNFYNLSGQSNALLMFFEEDNSFEEDNFFEDFNLNIIYELEKNEDSYFVNSINEDFKNGNVSLSQFMNEENQLRLFKCLDNKKCNNNKDEAIYRLIVELTNSIENNYINNAFKINKLLIEKLRHAISLYINIETESLNI